MANSGSGLPDRQAIVRRYQLSGPRLVDLKLVSMLWHSSATGLWVGRFGVLIVAKEGIEFDPYSFSLQHIYMMFYVY